MTLITDNAPTYPAIIQAMEPHAYTDQPISHVDQKGSNNRIESDHVSLKQITDPGKGFGSSRTAKATLRRVEAFRTIKRGHLFEPMLNSAAELCLVNELCGIAA